jgi:hypothetical protein
LLNRSDQRHWAGRHWDDRPRSHHGSSEVAPPEFMHKQPEPLIDEARNEERGRHWASLGSAIRAASCPRTTQVLQLSADNEIRLKPQVFVNRSRIGP